MGRIENDLRGRDEIQKLLAEESDRFEKLDEKEREYFDRDRLFNPFSDTRILYGDAELEVEKAIIGIDMEVSEVLLGGKVAELEDVEKIFREKLKLLNLLVEEFSMSGNREEWLGTILAEIAKIDPVGKLARYLQVADSQVKGSYGAKADLTKKEISEAFEKLVNSVCKRAIGVFGFVEVKQRFKGVIEKLAAAPAGPK